MGAESAPAKRVVVTGVGCVTPLGANYPATMDAALAGVSGVGPLSHFDAKDFSCRIAAEYRSELAPGVLGPRDLRRTDRCVLFALEATAEALADSGLEIDQGTATGWGWLSGRGSADSARFSRTTRFSGTRARAGFPRSRFPWAS